MAESIKNKTAKGIFWSGLDKFSFEIIQFVVGIVMARLLLPSDYGVVGIMMVFISFSTLFIDGGLATALIQKTNRTNEDFNTAFIYNLFISLLLYILLFLLSPYIADFYGKPEIRTLLRVLTINLLISPFSSIQNTRLTIDVDFKKISLASVSSGIVSGIMGVILAYNGFGVWALVCQQLIMNTCKTIILNYLSRWKPNFTFSKESFKDLFSFGYKLILTNIIARIYNNLYPLIIGKLFPINTLGYYSRGHQYSELPAKTLRDLFIRVSFPVFASIKDDNEKLKRIYRIYIESSSFVIFPIMFSLLLVSRPLIICMLTEKWSNAVPFLQLFCIGAMFEHISAINLNLLFVKGRSDLALKLEVIKKSVALTILFVSVIGGIWAICLGQVIYSFLATFLNSKYTKSLIGLTYWNQFKDYIKVWVTAALSLVLPYVTMQFLDNAYIQIFIGIISYFVFYLFASKLFKINSLYLLIDFLRDKRKTLFNRNAGDSDLQ